MIIVGLDKIQVQKKTLCLFTLIIHWEKEIENQSRLKLF